MQDYIGKTVYVGIDVHKKSYSVHCICAGTKVKSWRMESNAEQLVKQLRNYFSGAVISTVYEAGFSGFSLHRILVKSGISSIVVNPSSVETASRDRVKTDKRDAKKLSEQLSDGRLQGIHIPSEQEELLRLSTRQRTMIINDRKRVTCRIKSKLFQFGYHGLVPEEQANATWIKKVRNYEGYPEALQIVIQYLCDEWLRYAEELKRITQRIKAESKSDEKYAARENIYKSVPGLGDISASELSRELGDLHQFGNSKHLYSYLGFTPSESSSGERRRQGGISRCGRPRLRQLLIQVAWRSIAKDNQLYEKFNQLAYRRGKKRAIVAIARILIGRIRACFKNGTLYEQQATPQPV